jgi:hypothetical protein
VCWHSHVACILFLFLVCSVQCSIIRLPPPTSIWNVKEIASKTTQYNIAYDYSEHHLSQFEHGKSKILPAFYEIISNQDTRPNLNQNSMVTTITYETSIHLIPIFKSFLHANSVRIPIHKQIFVQRELNNIAYYYYITVKPPYVVRNVYLHGKILLLENQYKVANMDYNFDLPFYASFMRSKVNKEIEKSQNRDIEISIANFKIF